MLEDYTASDHQYILFKLKSSTLVSTFPRSVLRHWHVGRVEVERFTTTMARGVDMAKEVDGIEAA